MKALDIISMLEKNNGESHVLALYKDRVHIAAELRRLHELNAEFVAVCESVIKNGIGASDLSLMRKLVVKAKEQA